MENEADWMTVDDSLEAHTVDTLRRLFENDLSPNPSPRVERPEATDLIGDVTDTHHPDRAGRVLVRWSTPEGTGCERWLECLDGVTPRIGDRVLLQVPANWPEHLVCGVLRRAGSGDPVEPTIEPAVALEIAPDKCVQVSDASGRPLLQVRASPDGPIVTLQNRNVNIEVAGKLRLSAQTLELEGGRGGVDIRTEADTVVRSRYVRLN